MSFKSCLAAVLVFASMNAYGATWYVATNGKDGDACGSSSVPCATVSYVLSNKVAQGDTIRMGPGTYSNQGTISFSNTSRHRNVTLTGDDPSNRPLIAGSSSGISIGRGVTGVTVSHLAIRGRTNPFEQQGGISQGWSGVITINAPQTTIDSVEVFNGGNLIGIGTSKQVTIRNSYLHHGGSRTWPNCGSDDNHGIGIYNWWGDAPAASWEEAMVFEGNVIHNVEGDGIQELGQYASSGNVITRYVIYRDNRIYNACEQGLDFKGTQYVKIVGNEIYDNGYGGVSTNDSDGSINYRHTNWWIYNNTIRGHDNYALMSQEGDDGNWYVWNNLIYENCRRPEYNWGAFTQPPPNSRIENNVFWNNNRSGGNGCAAIIAERGSSVTIRNNIFLNNGAGSYGNISSSTNATISNNLVYPSSPGKTGNSAIVSSANVFMSLTAPYDFRLRAGSPAAGAGVALTGDSNYTIHLGIDGTARPANGPWDLGVYGQPGSDTAKRPAAPTSLSVN